MQIEFSCPHCDSDIVVESHQFGEQVICETCFKECIAPLPGLEPGFEFDNFVLERRLGQGGMGEVWLATQYPMERQVAIKILSPRFSENDDFIELFLREVRLSGKIEHHNMVTAFTAGTIGKMHYLAMSYVDGHELDEMLEVEGCLEEREALKIIRAVAEALKYAWNRYKILHCDIKPSNIMLDVNGVPKLMDMGISKTLTEDSVHMAGVAGTPYYISPEQARKDKDIDFRADLYSLGATLYHLVTGVVPFDGDDCQIVMRKHVEEPLVPPRDRNPAVSKNCSDLIRIMMSKSPWERHSSWEYLISDIDLVLSGRPPVGMSTIAQQQQPADIMPDDIDDIHIVGQKREIHLQHKLSDKEVMESIENSQNHVSEQVTSPSLQKLPPKAIKKRSRWRNWLFFILLLLLLAGGWFGIKMLLHEINALLHPQSQGTSTNSAIVTAVESVSPSKVTPDDGKTVISNSESAKSDKPVISNSEPAKSDKPVMSK